MSSADILILRSRRRRWRAVCVLSVAVCIAGVWWSIPRHEPVVSELPQVIATAGDLQPLSLKLLGSPQVKRKKVLFPHGGSVFGEDSYRYRGDVEIDGRRLRLHVETYQPIAAVRFKNEVYLILRAYFWEEYYFLKLNTSDDFVQVLYQTIDPAFGYLKFSEEYETFRFRAWWVWALATHGQGEQAVSCVAAYTTTDPRWVFCKKKKGGGTRLTDFLRATRERREVFSKMSDSLCMIVEHSASGDDGDVFRNVCVTLMDLNPTKGIPFLCDYEQQLRASPDAGRDLRLSSFELLRPCESVRASAVPEPVQNVDPPPIRSGDRAVGEDSEQ